VLAGFFEQTAGFGRCACQWFFHDQVLACAQYVDTDFAMQTGWGAYDNGVNLRVFEQSFVIGRQVGNAVFGTRVVQGSFVEIG
jgi:hypothetical protein|tara:strand:+ start:1055 stop:1303 length:249 start_codon:yes stop_codon:yes gene_type:complete